MTPIFCAVPFTSSSLNLEREKKKIFQTHLGQIEMNGSPGRFWNAVGVVNRVSVFSHFRRHQRCRHVSGCLRKHLCSSIMRASRNSLRRTCTCLTDEAQLNLTLQYGIAAYRCPLYLCFSLFWKGEKETVLEAFGSYRNEWTP
jgi:hypothetical protein